MAALLRAALVVTLALAPTRAWAHDPALSGIRVLLRAGDTVVTVSTHLSRLRQAAHITGDASAADIDRAVVAQLHVRVDGRDFAPGAGNLISDSANDLLTWQAIRPGAAKDVEVLSRLYADDAASRTAVTVMRDGRAVDEALLDAEHPSFLRATPSLAASALAGRYITTGVRHILSGPDHVLFVIGLLLLGQSLVAVLTTITAFTLAHSITLSLAALGIFVPSPRIVEPLIALSIVAIAIENLRRRSSSGTRDYRPLVAFVFGLVHGFGFATALGDAGLSGRLLWLALGSFNVGVEIGQASIVIVAVPALAWLSTRYAARWRAVVVCASVAIGLAGGYWFVVRTMPTALAAVVRRDEQRGQVEVFRGGAARAGLAPSAARQ